MSDQNGFAEWGGYMEAKMTKLDEQFTAASAPFRKTSIFAGISIFVNGLTNPTAYELRRLMSVHGGIYHHYERSYTTYIIASNLPDVKVRNMDTSKIISAQWVVDSIAAGRMLDYTNYLLYTNQKTTQPRLNFNIKAKKETMNQTSDQNKIDSLETIKQELDELNFKILASKNEDVPKVVPPVEAPNKQPSKSASSKARTAVDPEFLPEFYNNSRLHHIATLGADLKQYVSELREKHVEHLGFPARQKLRETLLATIDDSEVFNLDINAASNGPLIMHIDMDCFFVSVGLRNQPHLRGQPIAVTHSKGGSAAADVPVHPQANREAEMKLFAQRFEQHLHNNILSDKVRNGFDAKMSLSEIASCSYEARNKGIRNGMFVGQAIKLCPELKTIPYDFDGYKEVAYTLYDTISQYTLKIEAVSCDEMYVDLSDVIAELKVPHMDFVSAIRNEVRQKTGCPCSAGLGANKLQARLATRRAKPDGQYYLATADVEAYISKIPAADLPGIGSSTNYILEKAGFTTCADLQQLSLPKLQNLLGKKVGETLYQFCRGLDSRGLNYDQLRKSVSAEVNYGIRFKTAEEVTNFLRQLCGEVHSRLCHIKRKTKRITLKVMTRSADAPVEASKFMGHGVCNYLTKSETLNQFTNDLEIITNAILTIMKGLNQPPHELRGIGIQLTKLDQPSDTKSAATENVIKKMFSKLEGKRKISTFIEDETSAKKEKSTRDVPDLLPLKIEKDETKPASAAKRVKRPNVLTMLQKSCPKKSEQKKEAPQLVTSLARATTTNDDDLDTAYLPDNIDMEVFKALPIDLRKEIIAENRKAKSTTSTVTTNQTSKSQASVAAPKIDDGLDLRPSTSRAAKEREDQRQTVKKMATLEHVDENCSPVSSEIDPHFLEVLPTHIRTEIDAEMARRGQFSKKQEDTHQQAENREEEIADSSSTTPTSASNVFTHPDCKSLLLQWIKTEGLPSGEDVRLISQHARNMIPHQLDVLHDSLVYLRKLILSQFDADNLNVDKCRGDAWLQAYLDIVKAASWQAQVYFPGRSFFLQKGFFKKKF